MKTQKLFPALQHPQVRVVTFALAAGLASLLGGCASEPDSHLVNSPPPAPPVTVASPNGTTSTAIAPSVVTAPSANGQTTVIVTQAPPVAQQEVVPPRPSNDYTWVPGYWGWISERYVWVPGHWEIPPRDGATWIPPRWEPESNGQYRFYEGYWS